MDEVVTQLLTYKSVLLAIAVVIGTSFIRRVVETAYPSAAKAADENDPKKTYLTNFARWWNSFILYYIPVVMGSLLAIGLKDFTPDGFLHLTGVALYGGIVGWFSSFLYKLFAKLVKTKTGLDLPSTSTYPPSNNSGPLDPPAV